MGENEANQRDYSAIPARLRDVYGALENELVWIHGRWIMYRQLFGTNELRIELLNDVAPSFFRELHCYGWITSFSKSAESLTTGMILWTFANFANYWTRINIHSWLSNLMAF